jgi:hypothetical protein
MVHNYSFRNLKPKVVNDIIRVGNQTKDGGYVISRRQIAATKVLIGIGVNDDWSFEEEFKRQNNDVSLYCYDFSVGSSIFLKDFVSTSINVLSLNSYTKEIFNGRSPHTIFTKPFKKLSTYLRFKSFFKPGKNNFFFQKGVSGIKEGQFITMNEVFGNVASFEGLPDNSVYVKMDIEESEYDIIDDVLKQKAKINGLAIEFHNLKHMWPEFSGLMDQLRQDYEVVHIHGNNSCGYIPGTRIPDLIELTLIKRSMLSTDELNSMNTSLYPLSKFDKPNIANKPDLALSFD